MVRHYLLAFLFISASLLIRLPIVILGLVVVPIALLFTREETDFTNDGSPRTFSQYPEHGTWRRIRLPRWALWWDNSFDGMLGDKRGWWANHCRENGRTEHSFVSKFIWAAIRNPANYFSRVISGCNITKCSIKRLAGTSDTVDESGYSGTQWYFMLATPDTSMRYYRLFGVWVFGEKVLRVNLGWKLKPEHGTPAYEITRDQDRIKGITARIDTYKLGED